MAYTYQNRPIDAALNTWIPTFNAAGRHFGIINECFDLIQGIGNDPLSADTHRDGGAADWVQVQRNPSDHGIVWLARNMGSDATWSRLNAWGWHGREHTHQCLNDVGRRYAYQTNAVRAGYDGLGTNGRRGSDPYRIAIGAPHRTWQAGIIWATNILHGGHLIDKAKPWGAFPYPGRNNTGVYGPRGHKGVWAGYMPSASGVNVAYAIRQIQAALGCTVDGKFGPETSRYVIAFKRKWRIGNDPYVGPITWAALVKASGNSAGS